MLLAPIEELLRELTEGDGSACCRCCVSGTGRGDDNTEAGRKPDSILEVGGDGAKLGPGCSATAEIPLLPSEAGAVVGIMAWACDGSIDPFFQAEVAPSSIGDSVTLGKATVWPELGPDTSEDVRDCIGPSLCNPRPEELC